MKKLLVTLAFVAASSVFAQDVPASAADAVAATDVHQLAISNMQAQCKLVMDQGLCRVVLDPKQYTRPTVLVAGVGRISTEVYLRVRAMGEDPDGKGGWKMCSAIPGLCAGDKWGSTECLTVRSLWKQDAPDERPPGEASKTSTQ